MSGGDKPGKSAGAKAADAKAERLAAALRANLKRRKAQSRDRAQGDAGPAVGEVGAAPAGQPEASTQGPGRHAKT